MLHTQYEPVPRDQGIHRQLHHIDAGLRRALEGTLQEVTLVVPPSDLLAGRSIVTDDFVPRGRRAYLSTNFRIAVDGPDALVGPSIVRVRDTADVPEVLLAFNGSELTGNAVILPDASHLSPRVAKGEGATLGKGLVIDADAEATGGSDLIVTLSLYFR